MADVEITQVISKTDRNAFIKLPWKIYANDPAWIPPLLIERKQFIDREKHPFFEHGQAEFFVARRGGEIIGRIAASDDPNYNALHGSNAGCFGLFECIDDQEVADALLGAAANWLRGLGRDEIMGPIDYSTNYLCGLLIDGLQHSPTVLTPHNPPYYPRLIERWGLEKATDLYAWRLADPEQAVKRLGRLAANLKQKRTDNVKLRRGSLPDLAAEARRLREIYNQAWQDNWGFVPFTEKEFDYMTRELKPLLVPDFVWLAEIDGEPVGFILCLPDINVALKKINGRLTSFGLPIGLARLLYHKSRLKSVRLVALGVVPKYRRHGIAEMLVLHTIEEAMVKRGCVGEASLILENNVLMNRFLEAIGLEKYKTYRIYRKALAG